MVVILGEIALVSIVILAPPTPSPEYAVKACPELAFIPSVSRPAIESLILAYVVPVSVFDNSPELSPTYIANDSPVPLPTDPPPSLS